MKITVVIPLYNKKETIIRTLNSVLNQTVLPLDILVINDGSTDGSDEEVIKLQHPSIRLLNQPNAGVSSARNKGIQEAKGDWIAFLDADDEWNENYIFEINNLFNTNNNLYAIGTNYYHKNMEVLSINLLNKTHFIKNNIITDYFSFAAYNSPPIHSSAVCIKRSLLIEVNLFSEKIKSGEDLLLWAKIASLTSWGYINKPLTIFNRDTSTKRIPENPDLVSPELIQLLNNEEDYNTRKSIKNYISFWHKIRASQYFFYKSIRFIYELYIMIKYKL
jgi:glycosyltransferase involved in cell wall biosynthesis